MNLKRLGTIALLQMIAGVVLTVLSVLACLQIHRTTRATQSLDSALDVYAQSVADTKTKVADAMPHIRNMVVKISDVTRTVAKGADVMARVAKYVPGRNDSDQKLKDWAAEAKQEAKYLREDAAPALDAWNETFAASCDQTVKVLKETRVAVKPANQIMWYVAVGGVCVGIIVLLNGYCLHLLARTAVP
jgi:hypothetical protein